MKTLFPFLSLVLALSTGCVSAPWSGMSPKGSGQLQIGQEAPLSPGDLVVAVRRDVADSHHQVVRLRRRSGTDPVARVQAETLYASNEAVTGLAVAQGGAWMALALHQAGQQRVVLLALEDSRRGHADAPIWKSPPACSQPSFDPGGAWLAMVCAASGRQPSSVLRLDLESLRSLVLVGERPRRVPSAGVEGDLYWVEDAGEDSWVMRQPLDGRPYRTHVVPWAVVGLWPQVDGSLIAVDEARRFVRLLPSGVVRDENPRLGRLGPLAMDLPLDATPLGDWVVASCDSGPCTIVEVGADGTVEPPLNLGGTPTAVVRLSSLQGRIQHAEDLATAPGRVLASHAASVVTVLGVALGTPVETVYSLLDAAGRHPYWLSPRVGRDRPRGVGVGWTSSGYCISFLTDERDVVAATELRGCAAQYLSPPLRPLLDRRRLVDEPLAAARSFLGPGVSVSVGSPGVRGPGAAPPIRRSRVRYEAPERGYQFEAEVEVLDSSTSRLLDGRVWLRLQAPGRRYTSASRP